MKKEEKDKKEIILSQWQICVNMANSVSERRDRTNNLFFTLNVSIITAISFTWNTKTVLLSVCGIIACGVWFIFINNFRHLNEAKFHVISKLEDELPVKAFREEWNHINKQKKYIEATTLEKVLPFLFVMYNVFVIISIFCFKWRI